jgi:hypothetical protein
MQHCLNCSAPISGKFCAQCGQKTNTARFSFAEIFHEFGHAFLHADKGIFAYAAQLLRQPGQLAQDFVVNGKRKRYFSPFVYFLVILTLHGLLQKILLNKLESIYHWNDVYAANMIVFKKFFTLFTVLIWALLIKAIYPRSWRLAEYVVVAMIFVSGIESIETLLDLFSYAWISAGFSYFPLNNSITLLVYTIYFGWAFRCFFKPQQKHFIQHVLGGLSAPMALLLSLVCFVLIQTQFRGLGILNFYGIAISSTPVYD